MAEKYGGSPATPARAKKVLSRVHRLKRLHAFKRFHAATVLTRNPPVRTIRPDERIAREFSVFPQAAY
jgi:hypothetical protein